MSARILVVDDILPNVKLLEAKLTSEYYDVLTAMNGQDALDMAVSESPDLILLDIMMPGMDGFEVCRRLKENNEVAHIPVVMVTALTDAEDKVRGLEVGADDFLSKPINDTALMARVRSLLRLKMSVDEWRVREKTASQLGVVAEDTSLADKDFSDARILVVEDKGFEQDKIEKAFGADHHLVMVNNGAQAMERLAQDDVDLLIVSLDLANEDGLRLCSHIKSNDKTRNTPILMLSNQDDMKRVVHGLEIGVHDYILRPLDRNELVARAHTQIRKKRFHERLRSTYEVSLSMALTDSLTGLHNRRYLEVHLEKLMKQNQETKRSLAVFVLDIDHFKVVNDTYGHGVGDVILKQFSDRLKKNTRSLDLVSRLGGEEFVVILPNVSAERAHAVAERLRRAIAEAPFECSVPEGSLSITTSAGGLLINQRIHTIESVLDRADKCLYQAKESGRNCVVFEHEGKLNPDDYEDQSRPFFSDDEADAAKSA
jgi:two-component system cell cycle response regulator